VILILATMLAGCHSPPRRSSPEMTPFETTIRPAYTGFEPIGRAWQREGDFAVMREIDGAVVRVAPPPPDTLQPLQRLRVLDDGTVWGLTSPEPGIAHWDGGEWRSSTSDHVRERVG
jgi:hypothetical protein